MAPINIEERAQEIVESNVSLTLTVEALKVIAMSRLASSLERIGMNDATGVGMGCLEKIGVELERIANHLEPVEITVDTSVNGIAPTA